jgi:[protein-PII] uridylyltransferase
MPLRVDPQAIGRIKERLTEERARLERGLRDGARALSGGRAFAQALSDTCDEAVASLAKEADALIRKESGESADRALEVGVIALGGYGRRELSPRSDVDLAFLVRGRVEGGPAQAFIDLVLYGLWDLGLEVGHATRTIDECISVGRQDHSVLTAMLEARPIPIPGRTELAAAQCEELERALDKELLSGRGGEGFITRKLEEAERRRQRYGDSIYLLEPDVKHGEGGLRELHTALWVARARWRARSIADILKVGALSSREARALERAYDFLLRVRAELHLAAGRRRDGLGFEFQEMIARTLGYMPSGTAQRTAARDGQAEQGAAHSGPQRSAQRGEAERSPQAGLEDRTKIRHGTERFMRAYYFHARQTQRVSRLIIERATSHPPTKPGRVRAAPSGFKTFGGMLTVSDREQFARDPNALMRIFRVAQEESLEIYSYTKDLIVESLRQFSNAVRRDPEVVGDFLAILEDPKADGSIVFLMHELGVLRRMIPEVGRVTARWQHSLYHVYTVDVHSLFVLRELKRLRTAAYAAEQPELSRRMADLPRPAVLYLGGFLHDIGKGWKGGDHSKRGALVAQAVGARLEAAKLPAWGKEETEDLVWLVKEHLTMSDISQRRDLSDNDLVRSFAKGCESEERLTMLHLLTFADMKATSPKVWNDWKGMLLAELFEKARVSLGPPTRGGSDQLALHVEARRQRVTREILQAFSEKGQAPPSLDLIERFARAMPERYLLTVPPRGMRRHIEPWREVSERGGLSVHIRHFRREGTSELTVVCPDRPGLLALLAGTLSANRLQILSAQIFSIELLPGPDGKSGEAALDILSLRDADGGICEDPARWARVREDLQRVIIGGADIEALLDQRVRGSTLLKRPKPHVETKIVIAKDASRSENVFDVFCQDHLGALYTIAKAFADQGLTIRLAKISTQGDRVADGFYVTDAATGQKVEDDKRLAKIAEAVHSAIEQRTA